LSPGHRRLEHWRQQWLLDDFLDEEFAEYVAQFSRQKEDITLQCEDRQRLKHFDRPVADLDV
jgi:hypothetical protein